MKTLDSIPVSKVSRASKLITTGAKIGINYLKYYKNKITESEEDARNQLNEDNASDIYDSLSSLKGSALKVAQMLSMDRGLLPRQYVERFSLSQFSVPPLSPPLVNKTFQRYFGKSPHEMFDAFDEQSMNAASIGQVHHAVKDGRELAVKIQYPGVAESISSDLKMVKPIAIRMFNLQGADSDQYFREVEDKLLEETDYINEIHQSMELAKACSFIPGIKFPQYYPEWSSERVITMDFMRGQHLSEFAKSNSDVALANRIGQTLWDFYMYQVHHLRKVHADPHPGNFKITDDGDLIVIDFGCVKVIPEGFYNAYFKLKDPEYLNNPKKFDRKLRELELLKPEDTDEEVQAYTALFHEMIATFMTPLSGEYFDFSDASYFDKIFSLAEKYNNDSRAKKINANRGSKHFIYINRTFFGLYSLLHELKANHILVGKSESRKVGKSESRESESHKLIENS